MKNDDIETNSYEAALWETRVEYEDDDGYEKHLRALRKPDPGFESALIAMIQGWLRYADATLSSDGDTESGSSYDFSPHWVAIGQALRGMIRGRTGRFDCLILDSVLAKTLQTEDSLIAKILQARDYKLAKILQAENCEEA